MTKPKQPNWQPFKMTDPVSHRFSAQISPTPYSDSVKQAKLTRGPVGVRAKDKT